MSDNKKVLGSKRVPSGAVTQKHITMKLTYNADNLKDFEDEIKSRGFLSLWRKFQNEYLNRFTWDKLREWEETFKPFGLSFDWGMEAEPFGFELI